MTPLLSVCPWGTKNLYRRQGGTDTPSRFFIRGIGFSSLCEPVWPGGKGARLVSRKTSVRSASALLSLQKLWLMDTVQPLTRFRTLRRKKIGRYVRRTTSLKKKPIQSLAYMHTTTPVCTASSSRLPYVAPHSADGNKHCGSSLPVSYTHLTLPTKLSV